MEDKSDEKSCVYLRQWYFHHSNSTPGDEWMCLTRELRCNPHWGMGGINCVAGAGVHNLSGSWILIKRGLFICTLPKESSLTSSRLLVGSNYHTYQVAFIMPALCHKKDVPNYYSGCRHFSQGASTEWALRMGLCKGDQFSCVGEKHPFQMLKTQLHSVCLCLEAAETRLENFPQPVFFVFIRIYLNQQHFNKIKHGVLFNT